MTEAITPVGHRVLVRPDQPATQSEGGILIPDAYRETPAMSGIVLRVGNGYLRDQRMRSVTIARAMGLMDEARADAATGAEAIAVWRDLMQRWLREIEACASICEVGQRVIFPMEAGHEIVLGEDTDESVVIVSEESILAVYDAAEETAA